MRILVIEDDTKIQDVVKTGLESECFIVDVAADGERGSYRARTNDYDAIILDNMLPKQQGASVCKEIRKAGKKMPIIVLSAKSEPSEKIELLNAGADDYLTKPFSFDELLARIRAVLRRPQKLEGRELHCDNLTLDTRKKNVTRGEEEIYLTRKEFALLEYFLQNIDTTLSRGMIMENVWDMNADPFSNTIEAHVMTLRKKIDTKKQKKLIHTVPGRGYKLSATKD